MSCDFTEKISLLIDGELLEVEARATQKHLNECVECQQARADFLTLRSQISNYMPSLSATAQSDAFNRIFGRELKPSRAAAIARPRWSWGFAPRAAAFASLILIAAIVGFIVYRATQQKDTPPAQITKKDSAPVAAPSQKLSPQPTDSTSVASNPPAKAAPSAQPKQAGVPRHTAANVVASKRVRPEAVTPAVNSNGAGDTQALTAIHLEKSELLLRAFRNVRTADSESHAEIAYERNQAQQLIVQNMMLKREADMSGDVQIASLLENLEPILLDIANLSDEAVADDIRVINERVERKNIVALLQVNSTVLARALDDD